METIRGPSPVGRGFAGVEVFAWVAPTGDLLLVTFGGEVLLATAGRCVLFGAALVGAPVGFTLCVTLPLVVFVRSVYIFVSFVLVPATCAFAMAASVAA